MSPHENVQTNNDPARSVVLDIEGMTCASCVLLRVENRLSRISGVSASVNLPLKSAHLTVPHGVSDQELLEAVKSTGYQARIRPSLSGKDNPGRPASENTVTSLKRLRLHLLLAASLSLPVLFVSMIPALQLPHWGWLVAVLTLPVVTWSAAGFHRAALNQARHRSANMDTLVSIGVSAAYLFSLAQLLAEPMLTAHSPTPLGTEHAALYFEVAAVVTTFLLLGRYLEARAKERAGDALRALLNLGAKEATVLRDEGGQWTEARIPADQLQAGDRFMVRPGEKFATDGVVEEGRSAVDTSLVTGESLPVEVGPGDEVTGATINTSGQLVVRARRVGADTTLAHMGRLVSQAQTGKAPVARLADRVSAVFVPTVLLIAALTLVLWWIITGDMHAAVAPAVTVLVISCPCALGLATPVALLTGTGRGAQLGILIKGPQVLEETRRVDTIVLDKTGTVTTGRLTLTDIRGVPTAAQVADPDVDEQATLQLVAALEQGSEHPVAAAILRAYHERHQGQLPAVTISKRFPAACAAWLKGSSFSPVTAPS